MSDRQKGIMGILSQNFPNANLRFCIRQIFCNLKSKYPERNVRDNFWAIARAPNKVDFNATMDKIRQASVDAYDWLKKINPKHWSLHVFDHNAKCDHVTNNITEF